MQITDAPVTPKYCGRSSSLWGWAEN